MPRRRGTPAGPGRGLGAGGAAGPGEPALGDRRIQGELRGLGFWVGEGTISRILAARTSGILAGGFLHAGTVLVQRVCVLLAMGAVRILGVSAT